VNRAYPHRRKVSVPDVVAMRADAALRRNAERMMRLARDILRGTPTTEDHAKRVGISGRCARQITTGISYKDVSHG
jgi:hypothetical protein